jgi:hypothetical protein
MPLAWVPRAEIVTQIVKAPDRSERMKILLARRAEIIEDCRIRLDECSDSKVPDVLHLAKSALAAAKAGHYEAAQALSVVLTESLITQQIVNGPSTGSYKKAVEITTFTRDIDLDQVRRAMTIAPIPCFYKQWFPGGGDPPPAELSRHASVHNPNLNQYSPENGMLSLLLVVSLLRELTPAEK